MIRGYGLTILPGLAARMNTNSKWRPVCLVVQAEDPIDLSAVKQWLQAKQGLKTLDLSDQGFTAASGPIADFVAAASQVSVMQKRLRW